MRCFTRSVMKSAGIHLRSARSASARPPAPARRLRWIPRGCGSTQLLGAEKGHRTGGGWISGAIYGANDGLAAVFGIVAGVSGATGGSSFVLTAGLAAAVASALSMATGAFLAERSEAEMAAANVERERREIAEHPEEEQEELSLFYQLKGINEDTADAMAEQLGRHPDAMLRALAVEEFGVSGDRGDPRQAALAAGISTGLGAIVPVIPFMFTTGTVAMVLAATVSLVAHFLVGAAKSLVTLADLVVCGPRDDARGRDRRRRYLPRGACAPDLTGVSVSRLGWRAFAEWSRPGIDA